MKTVASKYTAEQSLTEEEALKQGMEAKLKEFVKRGAEVYAKGQHRGAEGAAQVLNCSRRAELSKARHYE